MLGQPVSMLIPEVIGFKLTGTLKRRRDGDRSRAHGYADAARQRRGRQVRRVLRRRARSPDPRRPGDDRQHGARIRRDLRLLPGRRRNAALSRIHRPRSGPGSLVEAYARAQGMWRDGSTPDPEFTDTLELDLGDVVPSMAGPKRPQDRIALTNASSGFDQVLDRVPGGAEQAVEGEDYDSGRRRRRHRRDHKLHQHVESRGAGGGRACSPGTRGRRACNVKPWVKTSFAPGSQVVTDYLEAAGLQADLDARLQPRRLRLHHLYRQFGPAAGADSQRRSRTAT